jgi:serine/threonine-protein kinase 11
LENIGKGVWSIPQGLDENLSDLLHKMLEFDVEKRYTIIQIRSHPWFMSSPKNTGDAIPVPPLKNDYTRSSTVLPYLESYHYDQNYEDRQSQMFFTEHDLNGEKHANVIKIKLCVNFVIYYL